MATKDDRERFVSRWSRLKQQARDEPEQKATAKEEQTQPAPELPPADQLNFDSDFKAFMDKRVDDGLRRIALKKLFSDPRFNLTDGLDVYAEDYSALEDLPKSVVDTLQHARRILQGPVPEEGARAGTPTEEQASPEGEAQPADQAAARPGEQLAASEEEAPQARASVAQRESGEKDEGRG